MEIRDNVRRRRRERIVQLTGQRPLDLGNHGFAGIESEAGPPVVEPNEEENAKPASIPQPAPDARPFPEPDPDPEKWWKEQQKKRNGVGPVWQGVTRLAPTSHPPRSNATEEGYLTKFIRGLMLRFIMAALLFGAAWAWFHSGLPGSGVSREWTAAAVTRDMDFQAVEAWYSKTFGGSPSFLPMFRGTGEAQAVSGGWKRDEAVRPVDGRIVTTFAQDGSGVRIAAAGGTGVKAVYAGRVLNVALEDEGKATILVQHAGRIVTVYGNLERPAVKPGDWVEAGQPIGSVPAPLDQGAESLLYFAVKQNGKTLDPAEVVPFD